MQKVNIKELLLLSGLSEAYLDPTKNIEWQNGLHHIKNNIDGEISHLLSAIEGANGWKYGGWKDPSDQIEEYPIKMFKQLAQLKKDAVEYTIRNNYIEKGSKFDFITSALKNIQKCLTIFNNLINEKQVFLEDRSTGKAVQEFYLQNIQPLLQYVQQQLDSSYSVERVY